MPEKTSTPKNARASAALLAAGAFDATPTPVHLSPGSRTLSLWCEYTRGGAAGGARVRVELSYDGATWFRGTFVDGSTIGGTAPSGVLGTRTLEYDLPVPANGTILRTVHTVAVAGMLYARFPAAESGNTAAPGTLALRASEDA